MVGPILLPIGFGIAGALTGDLAGMIVGVALGVLLISTVVAGAAVWARQIGALLTPEDAWEHAPRPPGFGPLCDWVYRRTLPKD